MEVAIFEILSAYDPAEAAEALTQLALDHEETDNIDVEAAGMNGIGRPRAGCCRGPRRTAIL